MKDMKIDYDAKEGATMLATSDEEHRPKYPYGLELHLNAQSLKKLGMTFESLPGVGTSHLLHAKVSVESVGMSESANNKEPEMHMTLQITAMELEAGEKPDQASRMYGNT